MSKKETEFDRYERMKKIQREIEKRKEKDLKAGKNNKKKRMSLSSSSSRKKDWTKYYEAGIDDYDEVY
ncbi:MAG: hypothetical protein GX327_09190 [Epulopiscium sp.]|nr:hypothetical protein [Candidatus Epulonipiscium sp.]